MAQEAPRPVLVVEDDPGARLLLVHELEHRGHAVVACETAEDAWLCFQRDLQALVLVDWMLPGMNGVDLCRLIRQHPEGEGSYLLFVTARDRPEDFALLGHVGANGYLAKPLNTALLDAQLAIARRHIALVNERRTAERRLRDSESQLRALVASALDAIITIDGRGRIHLFNPAAEQLFGYTVDEMLGQNVSRLMPAPHRDAHQDYLRRYWQSGGRPLGGRRLDVPGLRKDGSRIELSVGVSEVWHKGRRMFSAIVHDVTLRKQVEAELEAARNAAVAATRLKSQFLATMSHELRTPMNGVIGMTGLLLDTTLDPEQRRFAETVRDSADALLTIINDILDYSSLESGNLRLESIDFDLRAAVEQVIDLLAPTAQRKGLELTCAVAPELPAWVRGDPSRLRQLLTHLVGNAVKFTERGDVAVRIQHLGQEGEALVLGVEVEDTGIGMAPDVVARLFLAFEQADSSAARRHGGAGLGLAICRRVIDMLGGTITVDSTVGRGTRFRFTVQLHPSRVIPGQRLEVERLRGVRILCVDDNAINRTLLQAQLTAWGVVAATAPDAPSALVELARAEAAGAPYRLAILDRCMPGVDGIELARRIHADARFASLPLVMLTSISEPEQAAEAMRAGMAAHLTKPVRQSQLFECLAAVVAPPIPPAEPSASTRPPAVLIVEDNPVNQRVARSQLSRLGCQVEVAANGVEAVAAFERATFDVIFMDCQMPEMDGYQATREIRRRERGRRTPIIALTANAMPGDRERCIDAGMDDYLAKPANATDLRRVLHLWTGVPAAAS